MEIEKKVLHGEIGRRLDGHTVYLHKGIELVYVLGKNDEYPILMFYNVYGDISSEVNRNMIDEIINFPKERMEQLLKNHNSRKDIKQYLIEYQGIIIISENLVPASGKQSVEIVTDGDNSTCLYFNKPVRSLKVSGKEIKL